MQKVMSDECFAKNIFLPQGGFSNAGRSEGKRGTSSLRRWHVKLANDTREVCKLPVLSWATTHVKFLGCSSTFRLRLSTYWSARRRTRKVRKPI